VEVETRIKRRARPDDDIRGDSGASQRLIGETALAPGRRGIVRDDDKES
jgi:hypothetical protein